MKMIQIILIAIAILAAGFGAAAAAQSGCAPRAAILERFAAQYGEVPIATGLTTAVLLIEVLASTDGASWTIIATSPDGMSCLIAAGVGWRGVEPKPVGPHT